MGLDIMTTPQRAAASVNTNMEANADSAANTPGWARISHHAQATKPRLNANGRARAVCNA
eukprot:410827-Prymnesium_polylepis.5